LIIRILGEGQYRVPEALCDELNQIDNRIVDLVEEGKAEEFQNELAKLISEIRKKGSRLRRKRSWNPTL